MTRCLVALILWSAVVAGPAMAADEASRTFDASVDRLWAVTEAVLKQLGWEIEQADRTIGWITTGSRMVEGEDYGVYAKGIRHRLRLIIKDAGTGKARVTVERSLFTRERILFVESDKSLSTPDRSVEQSILAAIAKGL
jgi:hypothetical protein